MMLDATRPEYFAETLTNLASRVSPGQKLYILLNKTDLLTAPSVLRPEHTSLPHPEPDSGRSDMADAEPRSEHASMSDYEQKPDFGTILTHPAVSAMIGRIAELAAQAGLSPADIIPICARRHIGIAQITDALSSTAADYSADQSATLVTSMRHYQALKEALEALRRTRQGLTDGISTEFVTQDMREALYHIGTITGQVTSDEILGNIFGKFCIGK